MLRHNFPWKKLSQIKLDKTAKYAIRGHLVVLMDADSARTSNTPSHRWFFLPLKFLPMPVFGLILVLAVGGGTAFAAERAIPGDVLYPVKIHVNEEVVGALKIGEEKNADWELKRAERRAQEALKMTQKKSLSVTASSRVEEQINKHEEKSEKLETSLEKKGDVEAAARIRVRTEHYLEVKTEVLKKIEAIEEAKQNSRRKSSRGLHLPPIISDFD